MNEKNEDERVMRIMDEVLRIMYPRIEIGDHGTAIWKALAQMCMYMERITGQQTILLREINRLNEQKEATQTSQQKQVSETKKEGTRGSKKVR